MTPPSSGRHRDQVPSPASVEPAPAPVGQASGSHSSGRPLLRVVKGEPSAEELAALTVVVAALSQRRPRRRPTTVGAWASFGDAHRRPLISGPGGWRASGRFA